MHKFRDELEAKTLLVAKVGGSLFDLPDLRARLLGWLDTVRDQRVLLVPGGGRAVDVVRELQSTHQLSDQSSHWLAVRTLAVHAHFLAELLSAPVVASPNGSLSVLDAYAFLQADEGQPAALEHTWRVTSDAIAARAAVVFGGRVALLKSVPLGERSWPSAVAEGLVDPVFAEIVSQARIEAAWVNLRNTVVANQ